MAGLSEKRADVIFAWLPAYLDFLARIFKRIGYNVFYLRLSGPGQSAQDERQRAVALRGAGIVPLPLEDLPRLTGVQGYIADPEKNIERKANQIAPLRLLQAFEGLYPNNVDVTRKLHVVARSLSAKEVLTLDPVNCWARVHPGRKYVLVYLSLRGLLLSGLVSNVRLLVVPISLLVEPVIAVAQALRKVLRVIMNTAKRNKHPAVTVPVPSESLPTARAVFVTHAGLSFGNLFQKTLFYSDRADSELHPSNLLHFDYCGVPRPSENIRWVCLGSERQALLAGLSYALVAIIRGIVGVRSLWQVVGLLLLARFYAIFMVHSKNLKAYPSLRIALIDYEIVCPKSLLLAFESRGIKTVATQERFTHSFFATLGSVLDSYLCGSEYGAESMRKFPGYAVKEYLPVGQYRSDYLLEAQQSSPPQILQVPIASGRKIVAALGYDPCMDWHTSQSDVVLNWTAQRQFLEDMIRLSRDISNIFIVLRYKTIDWVSLPVFAAAVQEIESSGSIMISADYDESFFSYRLCAHSHLVIAKHTSLADECLAAGIPVLFYEYTHNTERLLADGFDYSPARIMCFNYQEVLERSKIILSGDPHAMTPDYEYLKRGVYGGLGDGKVRERIHAHIESLLKK